MTQVQTKSNFFIYIQLSYGMPGHRMLQLLRACEGSKANKKKSAVEKSTDGYQIERNCYWFSRQMGCKSLGEELERPL